MNTTRARTLDITFGRPRGAMEHHLLVGAAASTDYAVVGEVFFASACSETDPVGPVRVPEGVLRTNRRGVGTFFVQFPGEAFAGAPDTFWVRWLLEVDDDADRSGCVRIDLDKA
jgi:hypothetical protein